MNCCICGSPRNVENAHPFEKGMGGRGAKAPEIELLTFPLCADTGGNTDPTSCHGAHHAGILELDVTSDLHLRYRSTRAAQDRENAKAASALKSRHVHLDGLWHVAPHIETDFDAVDEPRGVTTSDILTVATETFRALDSDIAGAWRSRAVLISRVYDTVDKHIADAWITETCGMSKALASKSRTVVRHLGESLGSRLDSERQYAAARAVKRGLMAPQEAVGQLETGMPLHDFVEAHGLCTPRVAHEKHYCCPDCGTTRPLSEYEVVTAD